VAEDGGELVAAHAGQCVIGPEALGKDVRDGLDQLLCDSRTVPLDHIVVPVHVDGQQRYALGIFAVRGPVRSRTAAGSTGRSQRHGRHDPASRRRAMGALARPPQGPLIWGDRDAARAPSRRPPPSARSAGR
jgi:hypothetical protein